MAGLGREVNGERVAEQLAEEPTPKMPGVAGPDALGTGVVDELPKDRVDARAKAAEERRPCRIWVATGPAERSEQPDAPIGHLLGQAGRVIGAITEQQAGGPFGEGRYG